MDTFVTLEQIDGAVEFIRGKSALQPKVGLILGSGLGTLAEAVTDAVRVPYHNIPHWPQSTVPGHAGQLVLGMLEGHAVVVMQGRIHYYEGYSMDQVTFPVRVMERLGIETLVVTNAAGAINPDFQPGQVMIIRDHIALIGMAGLNPLRGPNLDTFGPRFPDMSQAYDRQLTAQASKAAEELGIPYHQGVYICLSGPSFETPADLRFLHTIGADAVGMSTVPEVIVARHSHKIRVLGISGITNKADLDGNTETTHEEVLEAGRELGPRVAQIIRKVLTAI